MFQHVHELAAQGYSPYDIRKMLHLHEHTVRKYLRMEHFVDYRHCPVDSSVEPYREYLEARWAQGPVMIKTLWLELQELGFSGCYKSVWNFVRDWPLPPGAQPCASTSPPGARKTSLPRVSKRSPWQVARLLLRPQEDLAEPDATYRQAVCRLARQHRPCLNTQLPVRTDGSGTEVREAFYLVERGEDLLSGGVSSLCPWLGKGV